MTPTIIVDIDGTMCCRSTHDVWNATNGDRTAMLAHCETVDPIPQMLNLVRELCWHYHVELMTSRSEWLRDTTVKWMQAHQINFWKLHMRGITDTAPAHIAKIEWAKALDLGPDKVEFVIEDQQQIVQAWRAAGYLCLDVGGHANEDKPQMVAPKKWWPWWRRA
jgi:hypothetical protein